MAWSARRIVTTVLLTVVGVVVIAVGGVYWYTFTETRDPPGPRSCECELLKEWVAELPLTPEGHHLRPEEIDVLEWASGFEPGGGGLEEVVIDRDALFTALTGSGLNSRVDVDQPDLWNVIFFPGSTANQSPWYVDVTETEGIGIRIWVAVDGSPWGLETTEEMRDSYLLDREAAMAAQQERQQQAIETLEPLRVALETMVEDP